MNELVRAEDLAPAQAIEASLQRHKLSWLNGNLGLTTTAVPATLDGLKAAVMASLRGATERDLAASLTRLWIGTKKSAAVGDMQLREVLAVYIDAMSHYPADLALYAIDTWGSIPKSDNRHHWWPATGELEDVIREQTEDRQALRKAVDCVDLEKMRRARIDMIRWSIERIDQGRPFPEHRHKSPADMKAELQKEMNELLEAMEG